MKPAETRLGHFRAFLAYIVICYGLALALLFLMFAKPSLQQDRGGLAVFEILLGSAAAILTGHSVRAYRQTLEPRVLLRLTPSVLTPGGDYTIEWECQGGKRQFVQLGITLECREESTFQGYCDSIEGRYTIDWLNTEKPGEIAQGKTSGHLPGRLMHSFDSHGGHKVVWIVRATGTVPGWPGISDEYQVTMMPAGWKEAA